jgi:pyruvate dehydrogenase E2 component (dihydrolipoamide acetyltransferase)
MTTDIIFPHMSEEVDEGALVTWLVEPGAAVREGDMVATVQVEKVDQDVAAPASGRVLQLLVGQGDVARQGDVIARIGEPGEAPAPGGDAPTAAPAPAGAPGAAAGGPGRPGAGGPPASPAARRVARELGVDLARVEPSGPGGRIVEADVRRAAEGGAPDGQPLPAARRVLADRLRSWLAATAQYTLTSEVDVTDLAAGAPAWTAVVVRACALALRDHPRLASRWHDGRLVPATSLDVGVLVSLDDGLVVPVVRRADTRDVAELAAEIAVLAERARAGALQMGDVTGAVFAVSNLGGYPVDAFTPLIHQPATAILGVGRARPRPAVVNGRIEPRVLLTLSLTVDHQVIDGAPAGAFLADVAAVLADPRRLLPAR